MIDLSHSLSPRKVAALLLLVGVTILLTGCWSAQEIEDLAFVMAMGVDTDPSGVRITYQLALPAPGGQASGGQAGGQNPVWVTSLSAPSVAEAMLRLPVILSKVPFTGHTLVVVMGEEYAREGIGELLEYLARDRQTRDRIRLTVAFGKAEDVLRVEPRVEAMPAEYLFNLLRRGEETGTIPPADLLGVRIAFANQARLQIMLPAIQPAPDTANGKGTQTEAGDAPPASAIELKGTAVFRGDKLAGFLDQRESRGVAWLTANLRMATVSIPREEGHIVQLANYSSARFKARKENGGYRLHARVSQDGNLTAWPHPEAGITHALLKQIEEDLAEVVADEIRSALDALQHEFNADIVGLGEQMRRLRPEYMATLDWHKAFPALIVEIEVVAAFRRIGLTLR
ncbi:MAG: Spore germination protein B3 [Firmicutes bacterium]|nr:Spore germination protein B3 [candidate division NPL-UPA2 bacterium]